MLMLRLTIIACLSIVISVLIIMVAVGVDPPDVGNVLAVRLNVPFVKGLIPVMNIVLAYGKHALQEMSH